MNVMLLMMLLVSNVVRRMIDCLFVFNSNNRGVCVCEVYTSMVLVPCMYICKDSPSTIEGCYDTENVSNSRLENITLLNKLLQYTYQYPIKVFYSQHFIKSYF